MCINRKPSNSEFIAILADKFRVMGMNIKNEDKDG